MKVKDMNYNYSLAKCFAATLHIFQQLFGYPLMDDWKFPKLYHPHCSIVEERNVAAKTMLMYRDMVEDLRSKNRKLYCSVYSQKILAKQYFGRRK